LSGFIPLTGAIVAGFDDFNDIDLLHASVL
jgi:hypothetical protein